MDSPDLVSGTGAIGAAGALINIGGTATDPINHTHWQIAIPNVTLPSYDADQQHVADVDGDGYYDVIEDNRNHDQVYFGPTVAFGTGSDYSQYTQYPFGQSLGSFGSYAPSLDPYKPAAGFNYFNVADVNGDGLVDAIVVNPLGAPGPWGQLLVNEGPGNGWVDPTGNPGIAQGPNAFSLPYVPYPSDLTSGDAWVDLDGDGLNDIVHSTDGGSSGPSAAVTTAWLNTFHRPIIDRFPAGLAAPTAVSYVTITTSAGREAGVYDDSAPRAPNTTYMATPMRVVASTSADAGLRSDGNGTKVVTTYKYEALRGSAVGRGSQGFNSVIVTDPSGVVTTTTYAQVYPYTGLPVSVTRAYNVGDGAPVTCQHDQDCPANNACQDNVCQPAPVIYSETATNYCAYQLSADNTGGTNPPCIPNDGSQVVAPGTSLFLYPSSVEDITVLETGTGADRTPGNPSTEVLTSNVFDHHGNPTTVKVTTIVRGSTAN